MNSQQQNPLSGQRLVVVDVEGNGQQPPEIIELAALPVDSGAPGEMRTWTIRPQHPITAIVTRKVHGITNKDVAYSPVWNQVAEDVLELLDDRILVAHNAAVERTVLGAHLPDWQPPTVLDTLKLARNVWPDLAGHGLDQLAAIVDTAGISGRRHRAAYDVEVTYRVFAALVAATEATWPEILDVAAVRAPEQPPEGLW